MEPIIASGGANTIRMTGLYLMGRVCIKKRIMNLSYFRLDWSGQKILTSRPCCLGRVETPLSLVGSGPLDSNLIRTCIFFPNRLPQAKEHKKARYNVKLKKKDKTEGLSKVDKGTLFHLLGCAL